MPDRTVLEREENTVQKETLAQRRTKAFLYDRKNIDANT